MGGHEKGFGEPKPSGKVYGAVSCAPWADGMTDNQLT